MTPLQIRLTVFSQFLPSLWDAPEEESSSLHLRQQHYTHSPTQGEGRWENEVALSGSSRCCLYLCGAQTLTAAEWVSSQAESESADAGCSSNQLNCGLCEVKSAGYFRHPPRVSPLTHAPYSCRRSTSSQSSFNNHGIALLLHVCCKRSQRRAMPLLAATATVSLAPQRSHHRPTTSRWWIPLQVYVLAPSRDYRLQLVGRHFLWFPFTHNQHTFLCVRLSQGWQTVSDSRPWKQWDCE